MDKIKEMFTNLNDTTANYTKEEIDSGKLMSVLAYLGVLVLIPYFAEKENKFVRYHAIQGLNLFIVNLIVSAGLVLVSLLATIVFMIPVLGWILGTLLYFVIGLVPIGLFVLTVLGVVYAIQGNAKEMPIVNKVKFIKE